MNKPYANDWADFYGPIQYSESLELWWDTNEFIIYDLTSAMHNGIIGPGRNIRVILKNRKDKSNE